MQTQVSLYLLRMFANRQNSRVLQQIVVKQVDGDIGF